MAALTVGGIRRLPYAGSIISRARRFYSFLCFALIALCCNAEAGEDVSGPLHLRKVDQADAVVPSSLNDVLSSGATLLQEASPRAALEWLLQFEQDWAGNPAFDYLVGVAALEAGEPSMAMHAFERVTLKDPDNAGAWIDLALAHIRLGEFQSAEALLLHVESNFSPPPVLARDIGAARQKLAAARQPDPWHGEFAVLLGYSSNANAGLSANGLTLTPVGGGAIDLPVDRSRRPRADNLLQWKGFLNYTAAEDAGGRSDWVLLAGGRQFREIHDNETAWIGGAFNHDRPIPLVDASQLLKLGLGGGFQRMQLMGSPLVDVATVHAALHRPVGACDVAIRSEYEHRNYLRAGQSDAGITWLGSRMFCKSGGGMLSMDARVGNDRPADFRPGGNTFRQEVTLQYFRSLYASVSFEGQLYLGYARDEMGYSPLLGNNRSRTVWRQGWRSTFNWMLAGDQRGRLDFVITAEEVTDRSSIALFDVKERCILAGVRYRF